MFNCFHYPSGFIGQILMVFDPFIIAMTFWGGTLSLFVQYMLYAFITFDKKMNKMFAGVIVGLMLCLTEATLGIFYVYAWDQFDLNGQVALSVIFGISWFSMIQVVTWLYVLRINSLGKYMKFDGFIWYIPFIIGALELASVFSIFLRTLNISSNVFRYSSLIFSIGAVIFEIFMTFLLLRKLRFILEYQEELLHSLFWHIVSACVVVLLLEFIILGLKIIGSSIDNAARPFAYIVRIYVVIQFYDKLITGIRFGSSFGDNSLSMDNAMNIVVTV